MFMGGSLHSFNFQSDLLGKLWGMYELCEDHHVGINLLKWLGGDPWRLEHTSTSRALGEL